MTIAGGPGPSPGPEGRLLDGLRSGDIATEAERLRAATTLLESAFVEELYRAMRETVPEGITSGGSGEAIFSGMLDQHLAEVTAGRMDGGLGQVLYERFRSMVDGGGEGDSR